MTIPLRNLMVLLPGLAALSAAAPLGAQGTADDYRRALGLEARYQGLVTGVVDRIRWDESGDRLTFRHWTAGGFEFLEAELAIGRLRPTSQPEAAMPPAGAVGGGDGGGGWGSWPVPHLAEPNA